jgi:hypothetical protein
MAADSSSANYCPVSRKYLRYLLEKLNDEDSGAGTFAQLAVHLIHRRKCANIVPATEPSAGGDLGQDGRTQKVILDSEGLFRLYESPPLVQERWIFAFSIRSDWKTKLRDDTAKIIANKLYPGAIVFVTNQFIHPEHVKIDAERSIEQEYRVPCEILDGQWILDQLYEQDYPLAVEFLGCPSQSDPKLMDMFRRLYGLEEGGLSEEKALELEKLKTQVQYRNRYTDTPEHLVQDLRRIGDILTPYEAYLEEALRWYEEALPELERITHLPDGIQLLYSYFKALQKLPDGPSKIFSWLPKFIDLVFASEARGMYHYVNVWLHMLFPYLKGQEPFDKLYHTTLGRFQGLDRSNMGALSLAYVDEAILLLECSLVREHEHELQSWLQRVHTFLQSIRTNGAFPRNRIAGVLGVLGPHLGHITEYETCFELAIELESEQEGGFSKASTCKARALAHAEAKQLEQAIVMGSRAKTLWLHERSIRGYLLMTYTIAHWYQELGYMQAAEYQLLEGTHIVTWQPAYMQPDLFLAMIVGLAGLALRQGRVLRAYRWLFYYQRICSKYRLEPDEKILTGMLEGNLNMLIMYLYSRNRPLHDRLLEIADSIDANILLAHREINLSTDEEFEVWLSDLTPEEQIVPRDLRHRVHSQEAKPLEGLVEYDELAQEQYIEWQMPIPYHGRLTISISYPRDPNLARMAFTLATMIQVWSVFLSRDLQQLTVADDSVRIILQWQKHANTDPLLISLDSQHDHLIAALAITPHYVEQVVDIHSESLVDYFLQVMVSLMNEMALDPPDEIMALFDPQTHGEGVNSLITIATPAYLWGSIFAKTVLGVDDASSAL